MTTCVERQCDALGNVLVGNIVSWHLCRCCHAPPDCQPVCVGMVMPHTAEEKRDAGVEIRDNVDVYLGTQGNTIKLRNN